MYPNTLFWTLWALHTLSIYRDVNADKTPICKEIFKKRKKKGREGRWREKRNQPILARNNDKYIIPDFKLFYSAIGKMVSAQIQLCPTPTSYQIYDKSIKNIHGKKSFPNNGAGKLYIHMQNKIRFLSLTLHKNQLIIDHRP